MIMDNININLLEINCTTITKKSNNKKIVNQCVKLLVIHNYK